MGQAKIISGGPTGLYNVEIVKDPGKSVARLAAIAARLTALGDPHGSPVVPGLIPTAATAVATSRGELSAALQALDLLIAQFRTGAATREQVTAATAAVQEKQAAWLRKQKDLALLKGERASILSEQSRLQKAMTREARAGIWCTDLTEDLAAGATVGTMEMNGADDQIILAPGGLVSKSIGLLQHAGVSTPAAVFVNKARLPGWQKWKPTYRVGTITAIDYSADTCSVGIPEQYSEEQGLKINQAGAVYTAVQASVEGWDDFALRNPAFPLVANTADTTLTSTPQLLADLERINSEVNDRSTYKTDAQQYGKLENWQLMEPGGAGDCEDFALTKAKKLLDLGYAASAIHIEVGTAPNGDGHAWLVVQTNKGDVALDNVYARTMPNYATPYTGRRRQTGTTWSAPGVLLSAVPIEYMDGANASVFVVGDSVVVQFTGQVWTAPKVVGFETNPRSGRSAFSQVESTHLMRKFSPAGRVVSPGFAPASHIGGESPGAMAVWDAARELYVCELGVNSFSAHQAIPIRVYDLAAIPATGSATVKRTVNVDPFIDGIASPYRGIPYQIRDMQVDASGRIYLSVYYEIWMNAFVYYPVSGVQIFSAAGARVGYYTYWPSSGGGGGSPSGPLQY